MMGNFGFWILDFGLEAAMRSGLEEPLRNRNPKSKIQNPKSH
jgi:hypothetical protein